MRRSLLLGLTGLCAAAALPAQRGAPAGASGVWVAGGVGPGWARVTCDICRGRMDGGMAGFLRLGGTVNARLLVGAEVTAWVRGGESVDQGAWAVSAVALWYPARARPWYLRGGFGLTSHHAADGVDVVTSSGFGPQVGAGYEFRVGRRWRVAPYVSASIGTLFDKVKFNGAVVTEDANVSLLQIGIGVRR